MSGAYYNEINSFAAAWLRELIKDGLIAPGDVDERSITDVEPADLVGYTRCHFFAGIGGWDIALQLAGWPDDRPVWTGSCPCQPFSAAGKGGGAADARHLWPEFGRLIAECRPANVFGEQVASAAGRDWLTAVRLDLEGMGYAVGGADLCAAGVGAPHIRQRLWWVADANEHGSLDGEQGKEGQRPATTAKCRCAGQLAEPTDERHERGGPTGGLADALPAGRPEGWTVAGSRPAAGGGQSGGVADALGQRGRGGPARVQDAGHAGQPSETGGLERTGFWDAVEWLPCRDGKARPTQPGLFPLAHGVPNRVGTLRGAGNAIVPQAAAAFVSAYLLTRSGDGVPVDEWTGPEGHQ